MVEMGLIWSYQPPQSSQVTRMTVLFQLGRLPVHVLWPTALTMFATQSGPICVFNCGWSDHLPSGTTKITPPLFQFWKLQFCILMIVTLGTAE